MFTRVALWVMCAVLAAGTMGFAQTGEPSLATAQEQGQATEAAPPNLDSMIAMVRANMQADRASLVASAMELSVKESSPFWRIYDEYQRERARIDDGRVSVIKQYSESYAKMSDAEAKDMAEKMIGYDARLASVKKKYYKKFNRELPAYTVTKFFQVDHRLDLIMDMKVEWSLPPLTAAANVGPK